MLSYGINQSSWLETAVGDGATNVLNRKINCHFLGSASQMVPEIIPKTKSITQFIRTPHWLLERENDKYGPVMQWALRRIPFFARFLRFKMFFYMEKDEWRLYPGNETAVRLRRALERQSREFVYRVAPKKYHNLLIPDWEIACKVCVRCNLHSLYLLESLFTTSVEFSILTLHTSNRSMLRIYI